MIYFWEKKIQGENERGFTLVELIVSMGLFIVVVFGTTSAMLTMLDANRKAQAMRTAMEGLGFALDDIARSVRVGGDYDCLLSGDVSPTEPSVDMSDPAFDSATNSCVGVKIKMDIGVVAYYIEGTEIKKSFTPTSGSGGYSGLVLTPPEISISSGSFFDVLGDQTSDQPRIFIHLLGTAGDKPGFQSQFRIQTVVTARLPDALVP